MYRITPLDGNLLSPYKLLFNRKSRSFIPGCQSTTKSRHPESDQHIEHNQRRQEDQTRFYNNKKTLMTENNSNPVNRSTYTTRSTKNGNRHETRSTRGWTKNIHSSQGLQRISVDERTSEDTKTSSQSCYKRIDESHNHQRVTNGQPAGAKMWILGQEPPESTDTAWNTAQNSTAQSWSTKDSANHISKKRDRNANYTLWENSQNARETE